MDPWSSPPCSHAVGTLVLSGLDVSMSCAQRPHQDLQTPELCQSPAREVGSKGALGPRMHVGPQPHGLWVLLAVAQHYETLETLGGPRRPWVLG